MLSRADDIDAYSLKSCIPSDPRILYNIHSQRNCTEKRDLNEISRIYASPAGADNSALTDFIETTEAAPQTLS